MILLIQLFIRAAAAQCDELWVIESKTGRLRLTKPWHHWTNGQAERMNRTIKQVTVHHFHHDTHDQLRQHIAAFVNAYNFARRLKTLKGLTPCEFVCKMLDQSARKIQSKPNPSNAGTQHPNR